MIKVLHIIIAHEITAETVELCRQLLYEDDIIALHLDAKTRKYSLPDDVLFHQNFFETFPRIKVYRGDFSITEAILHSFHMCAGLLSDSDFVNILSGQDFPVRPLKDFHTFLAANQGKNFINSIELPVKQSAYHHGARNESFIKGCNWPFDRYPSVFFDRMNASNYFPTGTNSYMLQARSYLFAKNRVIAKVSKHLSSYRSYNLLVHNINQLRKLPKGTFFGGSAWPVLTKQAMMDIMQFVQDPSNKSLMKFFRKMKFSDEFVFPTILKKINKHSLVDSDLMYLNWQRANFYGRPAYIDEEDMDKIEDSNAFFCRKTSMRSIELIKSNLFWQKE